MTWARARFTKGLMVSMAVAVVMSCAGGSSLTAEQKRGKQIYEGLCDKCHKLIPPKHLADGAWSAAVDKYGPQLQLRQEEQAQLRAYLTRANDQDFEE